MSEREKLEWGIEIPEGTSTEIQAIHAIQKIMTWVKPSHRLIILEYVREDILNNSAEPEKVVTP